MSTVIDINALPLDNTIQLVPTAGSDPEYYAADNGVVRSEFYELGNRVVFNRNGRSFSWTPNSMKYVDEFGTEDSIYTVQDVPLETKANYARFNRAFPDIDDWWIQDNDRLKHQILVQGFQRDPLPWLFGNIDFVFGGRIEFDSDLRVVANGLVLVGAFETGEGIDIIDTNGNILFSLPQIVAYDSKIPDRSMTYGKYRVNSNDGGVLAFDIVVDNAWISSVERVYPIVIDPTVVVASAYDTSGNGGRKEVTSSSGWLVAFVADGATRGVFYKSTDSGVTWSQLCYTSNNVSSGIALTCSGTMIYAIFSNGTNPISIAFDAATVTNTAVGTTDISTIFAATHQVSIAIDSLGYLHASWVSITSTQQNSYNIIYGKSTDGGVTWATPISITTYSAAGQGLQNTCVSIRSNGNPYITAQYINGGAGSIIWYAYNSGNWTANGSIYSGLTYIQDMPCSIVKKSGSNIGRVWTLWHGFDSADTTTQNVRASWSDDNGATWNTAFKVTTGNTIDRQKPTLSENTNGDIYVFYQDGTAISYQKCADGTTTFTGVTTFASSGTNPSAQERMTNNMIGVIYMDASQVKFDKILLNVAPNAPTLTTKANFDATASAAFAWTFSDPNSGDTQSAYQLVIIKVSDGTTVKDTGKVASSTPGYTLPAAILTNSNQYQWKVLTYDAAGLVSPFSSLSSFYASAKPTTSITLPVTDGDTVGTSSLTPTWSFSDPESEGQSAYQVKLTTSADVLLWDSGKVFDANARALTIAYTLANGTNYKVKITTWDARDVASTEAVRTFPVSYTPPATATLALTTPQGYIGITITNPTPSGSQPVVSYNDLYRRVTGTTAWTRIARSIANNGSYSDYTASSGVSHDYKLTVIGNNGTSSDSAITAKTLTLKCVYIHDVTDPAGTIHRYGLDGKGRSASYTPNVNLMQFAGRTRPVAEYGIDAQEKISVQLDMMRDSGDLEALRALMLRNATICYRDNRGRKMLGIITSLPEADVPQLGYSTTLEIVETAQTESV